MLYILLVHLFSITTIQAELLFLFILKMTIFWQYYAWPVCAKAEKHSWKKKLIQVLTFFFSFDVSFQSLTLIKVKSNPDIAWLGVLRESIEKPIKSSGDRDFKARLKEANIAKTNFIEYMNSRPQSRDCFQLVKSTKPNFPSKKEILQTHLNFFNIQIVTTLWNNQKISFINKCTISCDNHLILTLLEFKGKRYSDFKMWTFENSACV